MEETKNNVVVVFVWNVAGMTLLLGSSTYGGVDHLPSFDSKDPFSLYIHGYHVQNSRTLFFTHFSG